MYERRLRNGESLPAVVVRDNNGRYEEIDGFHRIAAMKRYGCEGVSGFYEVSCTPEKASELRRQLNHREEPTISNIRECPCPNQNVILANPPYGNWQRGHHGCLEGEQ
jgi:hypothetical protein